MLALLVVGVSVTSLVALQGTLHARRFYGHAFVERLPVYNKFFCRNGPRRKGSTRKRRKKSNWGSFPTLTYKMTKPTIKAVQAFKNLELDLVEAHYQTILGKRTDLFGRLKFVPQPKPEKKK